MIFKDRLDAAEQLIPFLEKYRNSDGVVLAVPRGGVPLGWYISKKLNLPLEIILTKKIGHPQSPEYAIGAVSLEGSIRNENTGVPDDYFTSEIERIRKILFDRYTRFMGTRKPIDLKNKTVIIVDDGVATGNTMLASLQLIRKKQPGKIIMAIPVAPPDTYEKLKPFTDELICLQTPDDFIGVGQYYDDFEQVSDEDVIHLLGDTNNYAKAQ